MRVTIEGSFEQIASAMNFPPAVNPRKSPEARRLLAALTVEHRRLIRQAFDVVRYKDRHLANLFAGVLGGSRPLDATIISGARNVLSPAGKGAEG